MKSYLKGKFFEDMAVSFLINKGYYIVERNYRIRTGEIDIIAKDGNTLVFVEVRFRKNIRFGVPEETINYKKIKNIINTAHRYISMNKVEYDDIRFDVIAIENEEIRHILNAFDLH